MSWFGEPKKLLDFFNNKKKEMLSEIKPLVKNMESRGGGVLDLKLIDKNSD